MKGLQKVYNNQLEKHQMNFIQKIVYSVLSWFKKESIDVEETEVFIDPRLGILKNSMDKIHGLRNLLTSVEEIKFIDCEKDLEIFNKIMEITKDIHLTVNANEEIKPQKLEQYHLYYTDNLMSLINTLKVNREEITVLKFNNGFTKYSNYIESNLRKGFTYDDIEHEKNSIEDEYKCILPAEYKNSPSLQYIDSSKLDGLPIFFAKGKLFKICKNVESGDLYSEELKTIVDHAWDKVEENKKLIPIIEIRPAQNTLLLEFIEKIEEFRKNIEGKEEKIELEMTKMRVVLDTKPLEI